MWATLTGPCMPQDGHPCCWLTSAFLCGFLLLSCCGRFKGGVPTQLVWRDYFLEYGVRECVEEKLKLLAKSNETYILYILLAQPHYYYYYFSCFVVVYGVITWIWEMLKPVTCRQCCNKSRLESLFFRNRLTQQIPRNLFYTITCPIYNMKYADQNNRFLTDLGQEWVIHL